MINLTNLLIKFGKIILLVIIAIAIFVGLIFYLNWTGSGYFVLGNFLIIVPIIYYFLCKHYKVLIIKHNKKVIIVLVLIGTILTVVNIFQLKKTISSNIINCKNQVCSTSLVIPNEDVNLDLKRYTFQFSYDEPLLRLNCNSVISYKFENGYDFKKNISCYNGTHYHHYAGSRRYGYIWIDASEIKMIPSGNLYIEINPYLYNFKQIILYKFIIPRPKFLINFFEVIGLTSK